jgi:hypothetical protein
MSDEKSLDPQAALFVAKARRLLMIASATTFLAVGVVLAVIGYRVFHLGGSGESAPRFADVTAALPAGAKLISTAVGSDHIVVTIEVAGRVEVLTFDPDTLKPLGRLRLEPQP